MHNPKLSENEVQRFEREVQQKMEELEFSPSAAVWENVARAVRVEKKRRVPFFWLFFLPALLLVGGTGIYLMTGQAAKDRNKSNGQAVALQTGNIPSTANPSQQTNPSQQAGSSQHTKPSQHTNPSQQTNISEQIDPSQPGNNSVTNAQLTHDGGAKTSPSANKGGSTGNRQPTHAAGRLTEKDLAAEDLTGSDFAAKDLAAKDPAAKNKDLVSNDPSSVVKNTIGLPKNTASLPKNTGNRIRGKATTNLTKGSTSPPDEATAVTEMETTQGIFPTDKEIAKSKLNGDIDPQAPSGTTAKATEKATSLLWAANHLHPVDIKTRDAIQAAALPKSPAVAKPRLSPKRSWEAGFSGGVGISSINQTLFKSASVPANDSRNYAAAPVPVTGSVNQTYVSKIKPDLSFWAGIVLQKPIANNLSVSVGLNLHYYSTKVSTGGKVVNNASSLYYNPASSLLNNIAAPAPTQSYPYYAAGDRQSFINRYYFLEIPGLVQWQISHMHNLPLFWEVGGSLSYLMSANAIYYNTKAGVYYKDGQVSNKTQFNVSTALMMSIPLKGWQMQLGPQVQYGVTSLLNTGGSDGQHFLYGGVKLVLFRSKGHKTSRRFSHEQ